MKKYSILLLLNIAFNLSAGDAYTPEGLGRAADIVVNILGRDLEEYTVTNPDTGELVGFNTGHKNISKVLNDNGLWNNHIKKYLDLAIFKKLNLEHKIKKWALEEAEVNGITLDVLGKFFKLKGISDSPIRLYEAQGYKFEPAVPFDETINRITAYVKNPFNPSQYEFIRSDWLTVNPEDQNLNLLKSYITDKF